MTDSSPSPPRRPLLVLGVLLGVSVLGILVGAYGLLRPGTDRIEGPLSGRRVPSLSLPVVSGPGEGAGDRIDLGATEGKPLVLDFWASWCAPCRASIPVLNALHDEHGDRVRFWGINVEPNRPPAFIREAHRDFGAGFGSLLDERGDAQAAFGVDAIPTIVVVDGRGVVRWMERGVPSRAELGQRLRSIVGGTER